VYSSPPQSLYPPTSSSSTQPSFPTTHRFSIPLPERQLPSTLSLSDKYGSITYTLTILLTLSSGEVITETINIEGTPYDTAPPDSSPTIPPEEVEQIVDKDGVRCRVLLDNPEPRLGALVRLGIEIQRTPREKRRSQAGPSETSTESGPSPATRLLRQLRRVRVELFRRVTLIAPTATSSSSTSPTDEIQSIRLLYTSGKSLRYPGNTNHPPVRVLFTLPTQSSTATDGSWGEITQIAGYHDVGFFIRVSIGFGMGGVGGSRGQAESGGDWIVELPMRILPKRWKQINTSPTLSQDEVSGTSQGIAQHYAEEDAAAREAYRRKGMDTVGSGITYRDDGVGGSAVDGDDLPPPFDGPSGSGAGGSGDGGLPSFLESEQEVRAARAAQTRSREERRDITGRSVTLRGELGTWVEVGAVSLLGYHR
jgi:hypothetical protein